VEASLRDLEPDDLAEQLGKYLADAHAIEKQAIQLLDRAPDASDDAQLADTFAEHLRETREHERLIAERIAARGGDTSTLKDAAMRSGGLSWATFFESHPDTPGKLVAFAYAFEHLEIAAYEELKRVAARVGDADTVRVAADILAQERAAAAKLETMFDRAAEISLQEVGAS
jgi:ferritin-like metal-binding protein YciE